MNSKIISHVRHPNYVAKREGLTYGRYNGAYYYAQDIENIIIPLVKTDRFWDLLSIKAVGSENHSIAFCHNYLHPEAYDWYKKFSDVIFVISDRNFIEPMMKHGKVILLPLSTDVATVKKYRVKEKDQDACFMGNMWGFRKQEVSELVPPEVHRFGEMPREELWSVVAHYKYVYAIGICAIEAQVLGCRLKMSRYRYPDPEKSFPIFDCRDAAKCLQEALDTLESTNQDFFDCTETETYKEAIDKYLRKDKK